MVSKLKKEKPQQEIGNHNNISQKTGRQNKHNNSQNRTSKLVIILTKENPRQKKITTAKQSAFAFLSLIKSSGNSESQQSLSFLINCPETFYL